jgi:hypothetical protein
VQCSVVIVQLWPAHQPAARTATRASAAGSCRRVGGRRHTPQLHFDFFGFARMVVFLGFFLFFTLEGRSHAYFFAQYARDTCGVDEFMRIDDAINYQVGHNRLLLRRRGLHSSATVAALMAPTAPQSCPSILAELAGLPLLPGAALQLLQPHVRGHRRHHAGRTAATQAGNHACRPCPAVGPSLS